MNHFPQDTIVQCYLVQHFECGMLMSSPTWTYNTSQHFYQAIIALCWTKHRYIAYCKVDKVNVDTPNSTSIFMVVGFDEESSHPWSRYKSQRLSFQISCTEFRVKVHAIFLLKRSHRSSQLCSLLTPKWCLLLSMSSYLIKTRVIYLDLRS